MESAGVSARRRLLKGALAVPAVLTLHSGSAFAMASSGRCLVNQDNNPIYPQYQSGASPSDTYVRVPLWRLRPNDSTTTDVRWYLRGLDFDALYSGSMNVTNYYLTTGQWKQVNPADFSQDFAKVYSMPVWSNGNAGVLSPDGGWVAVRVAPTGAGAEILGIVGASSDGTGVAGTCWTSVISGGV